MNSFVSSVQCDGPGRALPDARVGALPVLPEAEPRGVHLRAGRLLERTPVLESDVGIGKEGGGHWFGHGRDSSLLRDAGTGRCQTSARGTMAVVERTASITAPLDPPAAGDRQRPDAARDRGGPARRRSRPLVAAPPLEGGQRRLRDRRLRRARRSASTASGTAFVDALGAASVGVLAGATLMQVIWLIARSEAWYVCVDAAGGDCGRRPLYRAAAVGYLGNLLNPNFGLAVRIAELRRTVPDTRAERRRPRRGRDADRRRRDRARGALLVHADRAARASPGGCR